MHAIYHDLEIKAPIQAIFEAISEPEQLIHWWPQKCSGEPKKNAMYNFFFTSAYDWYGKVVQVVQNKAFYIKMITADEDWNPTTFGFDLKQQANSVLVQFSHTGWSACNAHFRRTSYCWALLLKGLENYVEHDIIIPFHERS